MTTAQPRLRLVTNPAHDLPPLWDGQPVTWRKWHRMTGVRLCSKRGIKTWCHCGNSGTEIDVCSGLIDGRARFNVQRCTSCSADTVVEIIDDAFGEVWDLEWPGDYGDQGSNA